MSVGSPATASTQNSEPITAQLITIDNAGLETVVGSYDLAPGASVDVSPVAGAPGSRHRLRFNVLRGNVSVTVNGRKRVLKSGQLATVRIG
jgi:quercetin dioxygenase-like cupin family protein